MSQVHLTSIDQVITELNSIIATAKKDQSPLGYFAALYRKVTLEVQKGIKRDEFDNGKRMEKLDVIFASRYINAYYAFKANEKTSLCWVKAFKLSEDYWPIVLQHLLMGMNAHINLDLGIAAAQTMKDEQIKDLKNDFNKINGVLASLVSDIENDLSTIWPTLKSILKYTHKVDGFLVNFAMEKARDEAWEFALKLWGTQEQNIQKEIATKDIEVENIGNLITPKELIASSIFGIIRLGEKGNVSQKITDLMN